MRDPNPRQRRLANTIILAFAVIATLYLLVVIFDGDDAHGRPAEATCSPACIHRVKARQWRQHRLDVIRPYRAWLGRVGACESGTDTNLHHGLRAIGGGGRYRGRYQFSVPTWEAAGGKGDPAAASWLEQAYRAVRWRKRIGNPHQTAGWPVCG